MRQCSGIRLQALDGFPSNICRACFTMLTVAFNFRQLCLRSDTALRNNSGVKTEENNKEIAGMIEDTDDIDWNAEELCNGDAEKNSDIDYNALRRNVKTEKSIMEIAGNEEIEDLDWISEDVEDSHNAAAKKPKDSDENQLFLKSWDGASTEYFYCLVCGAEFQDRGAVVAHTEKEHLGGARGFKCYGCAKELETRWARELHEDLDCPNMPPGTKYRCR